MKERDVSDVSAIFILSPICPARLIIKFVAPRVAPSPFSITSATISRHNYRTDTALSAARKHDKALFQANECQKRGINESDTLDYRIGTPN